MIYIYLYKYIIHYYTVYVTTSSPSFPLSSMSWWYEALALRCGWLAGRSSRVELFGRRTEPSFGSDQIGALLRQEEDHVQVHQEPWRCEICEWPPCGPASRAEYEDHSSELPNLLRISRKTKDSSLNPSSCGRQPTHFCGAERHACSVLKRLPSSSRVRGFLNTASH